MVPRVVAQERRGRTAGAGARAARAAAGPAAAPHPLRRAEVPGGRCGDGRRSTRRRRAGPGVLLRGDLTAFPHLLELGPAVLEPDFDLCGKRTRALVEETRHQAREEGRVPRPPARGGSPAPCAGRGIPGRDLGGCDGSYSAARSSQKVQESWCLCTAVVAAAGGDRRGREGTGGGGRTHYFTRFIGSAERQRGTGFLPTPSSFPGRFRLRV